MKQVNDFLASKYSEYLKELRETKAFTPFMPYGWFRAPTTVRLDAEFGPQQMVYRDLAGEAARDLANGINHLINLTQRLGVWQKVIEGLDVLEKGEILHEFVQDLASTALLSPYTLKARFYFAAAHLSHQANCVLQGEKWSDDFDTLPEDWKINEEWACKLAKPWRSWKKLIRVLNRVDAGDYKSTTDDFRNKHTHRFTPHVELGITQMMKRLPAQGGTNPRYGIGGSEPIKLETAVRALKSQCLHLSKCYGEFQSLVDEQGAALFGDAYD
ncbi:MAG: hypothetical protein EOR97_05240 [Mesorhizobium sp.]|uniref:hypothetical protein n=1 Tax=Mesorhizobium sp. TaxID=1871066 RepID=UPI000FE91E0C|nr:hypothetical protein [Mesorhizobium sp.]RWN34162.1 MAG: hypothetical protein EOR97_05240 [Mesorhizobium sp.]